MKSIILKVNPKSPSKNKIKIAAKIIKNGGLVAFPTETVYGLGADAFNEHAVRKIFKVKGRPLDNPVIVHIAKKKELLDIVPQIPKNAERLIEKFWPGPLTLVLKKSKALPMATTAGLNTVAVRMPSNRVALSLIRESGVPIAAPSANISGRPSPTVASHVLQDLNGKIEAIIDGGSTNIGVESTVLDLTARIPTILRPGGVSLEELRKVLGRVELGVAKKGKPLSPGMKYRHYAPEAELILVEGKRREIVKKIQALIEKNKGFKIGILATKENALYYKADAIEIVGSGKNLNEVAKNLFAALRSLDKKSDLIIAEGFESKGIGLAIMNKLRKAASKVVK